MYICFVTQALLQLKSLKKGKKIIQVSTFCGYCLRGLIKGNLPEGRLTKQANEKRFPIDSYKKLTTRRTQVLNGLE